MIGELGSSVDVTPLTAAFEGYELRQEGLPLAYVIDSPGTEDAASVAEFAKRAFASDLIIWVAAAHVADTAADRAALDAVRDRFAANPQRRMPPLIVVASHVDRLCEPQEWKEGCDLGSPSTPLERKMRASLHRLAMDLSVPTDAVVPMRLDSNPPYNLDLLWLRLEALAEEAQRARWVRLLRGALERRGWRSTWRQFAGARRIVGRLLKKEGGRRR
jgi:hypothetical protein